MDILTKIVHHKLAEIEAKAQLISLSDLKKIELYKRDTISLSQLLKQNEHLPIIGEFKRRSPSKSVINQSMSVNDVANAYQNSKFAGMSVLTDQHFFGGSLEDLLLARTHFKQAILRKDFTVTSYQIHEAKAFGADVILLIAAVLDSNQLKEFTQIAQDLGLEVLVEVHSQDDLDKALQVNAELIGINNRNLKTFEVDLEHSLKLAQQLPKHQIRISESGISKPETINRLKTKGFNGFLIGEQFMKAQPQDFEPQLNQFIKEIKL
jgi:indole-3-glycerol phosphate synthase